MPDFISAGLTRTQAHTPCWQPSLQAMPFCSGTSPDLCFHVLFQGRGLCAGQPRRCHLISSWTLQAATGFGLGVLAPGKPYNVFLVKLHLLHENEGPIQNLFQSFILRYLPGID